MPKVTPASLSVHRRSSGARFTPKETVVTAWLRQASSAMFSRIGPFAPQAPTAAQTALASAACRAKALSSPSSRSSMSIAALSPNKWCVGAVPQNLK